MAYGYFTGHCYGPLESKDHNAPERAPDYTLRFGVSRSRKVDDEWETINSFSVQVAWWKNTDRDGNAYPPPMTLRKAALARKGTAVSVSGDFDINAYDGKHGAAAEVRLHKLSTLDLNVSMKDREVEIPGWDEDAPGDMEEGEDLPW